MTLGKRLQLFLVLFHTVYCCLPGYIKSNASDGYCIGYFSAPVTRKVAVLRCEQDGGELASVPNSFGNTEVAQTIIRGGGTSAWLGLNCPVSGDATKCTNDDGTNSTYRNFGPGFPQLGPFGPCVYTSISGNSNWYSDNCEGSQRGFVCEYLDPGCGVGYTESNNNCYRLIPMQATHETAEENALVLQLGKQVSGCNLYVRIGLTYTSGRYIWDDGTDFNPTIYQHFAHEDVTLGSCVAMALVKDLLNPGYWTSSDCNEITPLVCKRDMITPCSLPYTPTFPTATVSNYSDYTTASTIPPPMSLTCDAPNYLVAYQTVYSPGYVEVNSNSTTCIYLLTVATNLRAVVSFDYIKVDNQATMMLYNDLEDETPFMTAQLQVQLQLFASSKQFLFLV